MRIISASAAFAAMLLTFPAVAQTTPAPASAASTPAAISPEQIQQLVDTLKQRNEQVRQLSERTRELEARAAEADRLTARVEAAEKALGVASTKNQSLVTIGEEIIADYEKMRLGKKIGGREPLTQLYRVRMQNELQSYRDKIAELGFYPAKDMQPAQPAPAAN